MTGFYLMPRGWMDNPAFGAAKREPFCRRSAWVWLVEHAAYQDQTISVAGKAVKLARGQLSVSLRFLAEQWGWSEPRVRRYLSAVIGQQLAVCVADAAHTLITICEYDRFCISSRVTDAHADAAATQQRRTADAHDKEGKIPSPIGEGSTHTRATRLLPDFEVGDGWIADGHSAREKAHLPPADLATEATKFTNHFLSKGGKDSAKRDWRRTWINWCLNARAPIKGVNGHDRQSATDSLIRGFGLAAGLGEADSESYRPPAVALLGRRNV